MSDHIEGTLRGLNAARKQIAANMTIGQLLDKLQTLPDDTPIQLTSGEHLTGAWGSYRGYYDDLYLEVNTEDQGKDTVGQIRETLKDALDRGTMTGYKGGVFAVERDTLVWTGVYGESGGGVVADVVAIDGKWYLFVKAEVDDI